MNATSSSPAVPLTVAYAPAEPRSPVMSDDNQETNQSSEEFDFSAFPRNTLFHDRRAGRDRRTTDASSPGRDDAAPRPAVPTERRQKKERRRRIDPTTFDKQYTDDELEFMNAMQRFKEETSKAFPSYAEVLSVATRLGYRRLVLDDETSWESIEDHDAPFDEVSDAGEPSENLCDVRLTEP
jgi:hypothetical protein